MSVLKTTYIQESQLKMTTSEVINTLVSDKLLGKYNLLRVLLPSTALGGKSAANLIPAVKSWLGAEQTEFTITQDDIQIDMQTNIYQHYSQRIMNIIETDSTTDCIDILTRPTGKLALFNVTRDDVNMTRYAAHNLRKYENIITGVSVDDRSNIIIPILHTPILHINIPEKGRVLSEKYLEYRFRLLEFGKAPAYIFIRQFQMPKPDADNNLVIGLEFTVDEKEFVNDARLAMIIKYISGLQILLGS